MVQIHGRTCCVWRQKWKQENVQSVKKKKNYPNFLLKSITNQEILYIALYAKNVIAMERKIDMKKK